MSNTTVPLKHIPSFIYGTAGTKGQTQALVKQAITAGFRAFDSAAQPKCYAEERVGSALCAATRNQVVSRQELWLQTKFTPLHSQDHTQLDYNLDDDLTSQAKTSIDGSLRCLNTDDSSEPYLDALLLHSPLQDYKDTETVWEVFSGYVPRKIRMLGLSNVSMEQVERLYQAVKIKPAIVQNQFRAENGYDQRLRLYCRDRGIAYQCYGVLRDNDHLLESSAVKSLSGRTGVQPEAILYTLIILGLNATVLNGSTNASRMKEDLAALDRMRVWRDNNRNTWMSLLSSFKGSLARGRIL